ncbi:MAG: nucleoside monophosphate kinase [Methylacidiphilales bacterium]|nr:nucleoside monophosphate kinase [Candidatus Methylacidiphilales bacterium]
MKKNLFYAQSGGVTSVINATAEAVILQARKEKNIASIYCGQYGILGALDEQLVDVTKTPEKVIKRLSNNPGGVFGSCRFKLIDPSKNEKSFDRLLTVFDAHNIGYFLYNGGGDSADTSFKIEQAAKLRNYPLKVGHIPKTIDNDLPFTDCSPGFASVAKYIAVSTQETSLDLASMHKSSTKVFILEVMGRNAGWIAASAGLAQTKQLNVPLLILFPEIPFNQSSFLNAVSEKIKEFGYVSVVVSEGVRDDQGKFVSTHLSKDAFGHHQLGGAGNFIEQLIESKLHLKCHTAIADYLQRSARHVASNIDLIHAKALGQEAVRMVCQGISGKMPIIVRKSNTPYRWGVSSVHLSKIANQEKKMPLTFISSDGFTITNQCRKYLSPLIQGEAFSHFKDGVGDYQQFLFPKVKKKLIRNRGYKILLLGPPGAGKGTQGDLLCQTLKIVKVSCGDILRKESRSGSELGKNLSAIMASGALVPDSLIIEIMNKELKQKQYDDGYLLDGFPRTVGQAQALHSTVCVLDAVIEINISDATLHSRLEGRWIHSPSGRTYHTTFNPPKIPFTDDITGEPLSQRVDDTPETIKKRLEVYYQETQPLSKYYKSLCKDHGTKYLVINGDQSINQILKKITTFLIEKL